MSIIQARPTIVNLKLPGPNGELVVEDSGWDERQVIAAFTEANALLRQLHLEVRPGALRTIELEPAGNALTVDRSTYFQIAHELGAVGFVRGVVNVAFFRIFGMGINGLTAEELCYVGVRHLPVVASRGPILAHELGHIVGLADQCTDKRTPMFYAWFSQIGLHFTREEIRLARTHPHVSTAQWTGPRPDVECGGSAP